MNHHRINLQTVLVVLLLALLFGLTNCGGGGGGGGSSDGIQDPPTEDEDTTGTDDDSPIQEISKSISQEGGSLSLTDDAGRIVATLTIPEGAVRDNTTFVIRNEPSNHSRFSDYYYFEPAGVTFDKPLTVQINIDSILENSSLNSSDLIMYSLADSGEISPINGSYYDATSDMFVTVTSHFSGNVVGPYQPTAEDIAVFKELFGGLTPELLEDLNAVYDTYVEGNTRPLSQSSYLNGLANVETWCDAQPDLQLGGAWAGDYIVAGYQVFIYSQVVNFKTDPYSVVYFDQTNFSAKGEHTLLDQSYLMMNVQPRNVKIPAEEYEVQEIFDITIRQSVSEPRLSVSPTTETRLDSGETATISANLFFNYQPIDSTSWTSTGKQDEIIDFDIIRGPGSLSASSQQTNQNGDAAVVFTADWNTSETEPEVTEIRASFHRGNVTLEETVIISEQRVSLVNHTYPFEGQTEVPVDENMTFWFKEAMDTSADQKLTIEPDIGSLSGSTSWTEGNTILTINPGTDLEEGTEYTVTLNAGATAASGKILDVPYSFTYTTKGPRKPKLIVMNPESGDKGIPVNTTLVFTFSRAMNQSTTENAFSINPSTTGSFAWQSPTRLSFIPDADLEEGTLYTVNITESATDLDNNNLDALYALSFTTESELPVESPQGVIFEDTDEDFNQLGGEIVVLPATDQSDIICYRVYWGDADQNKLSQTALGEIQKADIDTTTISLPENSAIPSDAQYLLAYSANTSGEKPVPASTPIGDLGGDIALEDRTYDGSGILTGYTKYNHNTPGSPYGYKKYSADGTLLSYVETYLAIVDNLPVSYTTLRFNADDTLDSYSISEFDSTGQSVRTAAYNSNGQLDGYYSESVDQHRFLKHYTDGVCEDLIVSIGGYLRFEYDYSISGEVTRFAEYIYEGQKRTYNVYDEVGVLGSYAVSYFNESGDQVSSEGWIKWDNNPDFSKVSYVSYTYENTEFLSTRTHESYTSQWIDNGSETVMDCCFFLYSTGTRTTLKNSDGLTIESSSIYDFYNDDPYNNIYSHTSGTIYRYEYDANGSKTFYRKYDHLDTLTGYTEYIRGPYIRYLTEMDSN